ncbi:hypothetical protein BLOT_002299 [Blomia tropicalis]|nr:hypothetical protein BLOT_002299 [Blomia tropicalis]
MAQNWLIDQIIPDDYNSEEPPLRPNVANGEVEVDGLLTLLHFEATKNQLMVKTDMMLCLRWHDYRLLNTNRQLLNISDNDNEKSLLEYDLIRVQDVDRFWLPKLYFRNAVSTSVVQSLSTMTFIEYEPNTRVVNYCNRLNAKFTCHFKLSNFPFDVQECQFQLETFGNSKQNVRLRIKVRTWTGGNFQFSLHHSWNGSCEPQYMNPMGTLINDFPESCAFAGIRLVRHLNYFIIRYYCPTFLCLCGSFCGFWVATNGWPGRIICTCVVYLTIKSISETAYEEVPSNDVVSLFWWLWVIQAFIYMNLVEYAWALAWVQFAEDKVRARVAGRESPDGYYFGKKSWYHYIGKFFDRVLFRFYGPIDMYYNPAGRNKVDNVAKLVYPSLMFLFVFVYVVATIPEWAGKYNGQVTDDMK